MAYNWRFWYFICWYWIIGAYVDDDFSSIKTKYSNSIICITIKMHYTPYQILYYTSVKLTYIIETTYIFIFNNNNACRTNAVKISRNNKNSICATVQGNWNTALNIDTNIDTKECFLYWGVSIYNDLLCEFISSNIFYSNKNHVYIQMDDIELLIIYWTDDCLRRLGPLFRMIYASSNKILSTYFIYILCNISGLDLSPPNPYIHDITLKVHKCGNAVHVEAGPLFCCWIRDLMIVFLLCNRNSSSKIS